MRNHLLLIGTMFFAFSVHCQNFVGATKSSDGQTITLANDEVLEIKLPCNPSTGYGWYPILNQKSKIKNQKFNDGVITQTGDWEFIPDKNNGMVGQPGTEVIRFIGVSPGNSEFRLEYKRPWEKNKSSIDIFKLTLISKGKYTGNYTPTIKKQSVESYKSDKSLKSLKSTPPSSFSWQPQCTAIKDQGQCGSCWTFAATGSFEAIINIIDGNIRSLSEQWLINCDITGGNDGCQGGSCPNSYWVSPGCVYESDLPYADASCFTINGTTATCIGTCGTYTYNEKAQSSANVNGSSPTVAQIKQAIYNYGPVWVAIDAGNNFQAYTGGVFTKNDGTTTNHAVVLVGWKDSTWSSYTGYWILRNSWNNLWGEHGYMRIAYGISAVGSDANYIVYKGGIACSGTPAPGNTLSSANPVCSAAAFTLSLQNATSGSGVTYQWQSSPDNSTWSTISGATNATYATSQTVATWYECKVTCSGNTGTSTALDETVNANHAVSISIAASPSGAICTGTSVTFSATPTNGGTSPSYQWKKGGTAISGATNTTYSYAPTSGDAITCLLTSNATCPTSNPATSNTITETVNANHAVSISIAASPSGAICTGTSVTFSATPTNGGTSPSYQWKKGGTAISGATNTTYSYAPTSGDAITCLLTSNATCPTSNPATSNTITETVNANHAVSISIAASPSGAICTGTSVTFSATPTNGGTSPSYQWKKGGTAISGATNTTYSYAPTSGDAITCLLTSNATCPTSNPATSNTITETVNANHAVSISIAASPSGAICTGTSVTFSGTPTNGGTSPSYQWKKGGTAISGATNTTYSYAPTNGDAITCLLTSNATCPTSNPATSNTITETVNTNLPVSVSIAASPSGTICSGTSVTFTATPTNGGTSPSYQWKKGGTAISGATNTTYSYTPTSGDAITCLLTSNLSCATGNPATSNTITETVNVNNAVSVSIAASPSGTICSGTSVTFTATPTNGGASPSYQWKKGGTAISGATNTTYSYTPTSGDAITCLLTSNASCPTGNPATSNTITETVNVNNAVSVSIAASPSGAICTGTSVTFSATPTNGGAGPSYQWKKGGTAISGATNTTYSYTPTSGDAITCLLTSNASCPTGNPATSNTITETVNVNNAVSVSIAASPSGAICTGTSVTFSATPTNGGAGPSYQWEKGGTAISGATNTTYSYTPTSGDAITCLLTSNASCPTGNPATSNTITETVNVNNAVSVSIAASPSGAICTGTSVTFSATPTNGGTSPSYQWKKGGTVISGATNATYSYAPTSGDAITCLLTSNATCPTSNPATSNTITETVNTNLPVSVSIAASPSGTICSGTSVTFTATPTNGGASPSYQWKKGGTAISGATNTTYSYAPTSGDAITCLLTSNASCPTSNPATSNTITETVNVNNAVSVSIAASPSGTICSGTSVTFTATPTNGGAGPSYQWKKGGTAISGATNTTYSYTPTSGDAITCLLTSNASCPTSNPATSDTITKTVNPLPAAPTVTSPVTYCQNVTAIPLTATGDSLLWYTTATGGTGSTTAPTPSTIYADSTNYYVSRTVNTCESPKAMITCIVNPLLQVTILPINPEVCLGNNIILNASSALNYNWSNEENTASITVSPISITTYSVIGTDINGCADTASTIVQVDSLPVVIIAGNNTLCQGDSTILSVSGANAYVWNNGGGTGATINVSPSANIVYTVTGTDSKGCWDTAFVAITVDSVPQKPMITQNGNDLISNSVTGNQWYDQNGIIPDSTSSVFIPTQSGNYYVIVTQNGCQSDTSNIFSYSWTGINTINNNTSINLYPNPAKNELNIVISNSHINQNLEIMNSIGKIVYKSNITDKIVVNVSGFADGIYIVRLFSDQSSYNKMFVKQ